MDYSNSNIPEFQCHKKVKAFKISEIRSAGVKFGATALHDCNNMYVVYVGDEYCKKHKPVAGGYYVLYKDGYESFSPAKAFEEGYSLIDDNKDIV